jgi:hypothetical protein
MVTLNKSLEGILQSLQANFGIAPSTTIQYLPSTNAFLANNSNKLVIRHQVNELVYEVAISETVLEEVQSVMSENYFPRLRETFDVIWHKESKIGRPVEICLRVSQGCTNPGRQVSVKIKFCTAYFHTFIVYLVMMSIGELHSVI